jgi:prevent-host-death family protein
MVMKIIAAGQFKAHCLEIMDEVGSTREPVVITKRGRPVAKLVLAWLVSEPERLSRAAASAIRRARASDGIAISDISIWELALLFTRGALRAHGTVEHAVRTIVTRSTVRVVPITVEIAALAAQSPVDFPKDPADRLIAATARTEGLALITRDARIRSSPLLRTIW